jgi:hypothetical protein
VRRQGKEYHLVKRDVREVQQFSFKPRRPMPRGWYSAVDGRFHDGPEGELTWGTRGYPPDDMTGPDPKAEIAPLLNGDGKILPLAQAVGMDLDEVMRVGPDVAGARLALYLIHILHERWIDTSIECK